MSSCWSRWLLCVWDATPHQAAQAAPAQAESSVPPHLPTPGLRGDPASGEPELGTSFQWAQGNPCAFPQHQHLQLGPARHLCFSFPLGATAMILRRAGQLPKSTSSSGHSCGCSSSPVRAEIPAELSSASAKAMGGQQNPDSTGTMVISNSLPIRLQEGSPGPRVACGQVKAIVK